MKPKTCAEIHLDNLAYNYREIQKKVNPARVIPVVKADAYGHGSAAVAKRLAGEGVDLIAVAQFEEAMELRESGISQPILIFGRLFPGEIQTASEEGFRITLFGKEDIRWIDNAGLKVPAHVHVNLDTGMGRVGLLPEQTPDFFNRLVQSNHCIWEGLYSHFSTSDEQDKTYARLQLSRFHGILSRILKNSVKPAIIHMANSGAILDIPESYFDAVRAGIILYGHYPSAETSCSVRLKQVMRFRTAVAHIRKIPAGHSVSYGRRWVSNEPTRIAVLPIGYADGVSRKFTNTGEVLIKGKRYPMVGTVTMDQIMVHVENDPITVGDEVILWGDCAGDSIQALEAAEKIGTIPYELTCAVSRRVPRVYIG